MDNSKEKYTIIIIVLLIAFLVYTLWIWCIISYSPLPPEKVYIPIEGCLEIIDVNESNDTITYRINLTVPKEAPLDKVKIDIIAANGTYLRWSLSEDGYENSYYKYVDLIKKNKINSDDLFILYNKSKYTGKEGHYALIFMYMSYGHYYGKIEGKII